MERTHDTSRRAALAGTRALPSTAGFGPRCQPHPAAPDRHASHSSRHFSNLNHFRAADLDTDCGRAAAHPKRDRYPNH